MNPIFLTSEQILTFVQPNALIEVMRECFQDLEMGDAVNYPRMVTNIDPKTKFGAMPAYSRRRQLLASKNLFVSSRFRDLGRSSHAGLLMLSDYNTGDIKLILDASVVTSLRTAAVSALATSLLARKSASTLGVCGAGGQAYDQIKYQMAVRNFKTVLIYNRTRENSEKLKSQIEEGIGKCAEVIICKELSEMLCQADVLNFLTSAKEPIVKSSDISAGTHVNAIGACRPFERELDFCNDQRLRIYYEDRNALMSEAYEVTLPLEQGSFKSSQVISSLGHLLIAKGQESDASDEDSKSQNVSVFKGIGIGAEDLYFAMHLYDQLSLKDHK
jgi:alanine dehydrogenase